MISVYIAKAKAILQAKGFSQMEGTDYFDTISPAPSLASIRLVVAVSLEMNFGFLHFHGNQVFVKSRLDADVYMEIPYG